MAKTLKDILAKDLAGAKIKSFEEDILSPGEYVGKLLGFTEEETYQFMTFLIGGKKYNFFYNYFIYGTQDLDGQLLNWIKALATIPVDDSTSFLAMANSAVGNSYKFTIYNYVSKSGKNAGKTQHNINFKVLPTKEEVIIETEEISTEDLPF